MSSEQEKITVVALCTALHEIGGLQEHLVSLYRHIDKKRFHFVIIFCSKEEETLKEAFINGGVKSDDLFHLPLHQKNHFFSSAIQLHKILKREKVDILHTFFLHSDIIGYFCSLCTKIRLRISSAEGKFLWDENYGVGRAKQFVYCCLNRCVRPHFYRTIAVSQDIKNDIVQNHAAEEEKVTVIHVGVQIPSDPAIEQSRNNSQKRQHKVVATAARFTKDKKLDCFLKAVTRIIKKVPQARFIVAGSGQEEQRLKSLAQELNIEKFVSFPGWITDKSSFYTNIDIFVMTSLREGCPQALLEALSFAKPVVSFNVPGIREIISDQRDGLLVEAFDISQLSEAIIKTCREPQAAKRLGQNGRDKIQKNYSVSTEVQRIEAIYNALSTPQKLSNKESELIEQSV